jgi:hypothetical protein
LDILHIIEIEADVRCHDGGVEIRGEVLFEFADVEHGVKAT